MHAECTNKLINLRKNLKTENTVDAHHQNLIYQEKMRWQAVLKRIVLCIQYFAQQN